MSPPDSTAAAFSEARSADPVLPWTTPVRPSHAASDEQRIDSLSRCFLYIARQLGRPVAAAELDLLAPQAGGMDEPRFLLACQRLGLRAARVALTPAALTDLPTPFVLVGPRDQPSCVAIGRTADGDCLSVLDVVDGTIRTLRHAEAAALADAAILVRRARGSGRSDWKGLLVGRARAVLGELLAASFAINLLALATPLFMMATFNRLVGPGVPETIGPTVAALAAGLAIAYLFDLALRILRSYVSSHTAARIDALLSAEVVRHLVRLPYHHFERTPSGIIAERLRQLDTLRAFFTGQMPSLIIDLAFASLYLGAVLVISPRIGGIVLLAVPLFAGISLLTYRAQKRHVDDSFRALAAKSSALHETLANVGTVKALGLEAEMEQRWAERVAQSARAGYRASNLAGIVAALGGFLQLIAALGVILLGVHEVLAQHLSIGGLVAASMLAARALTPLRHVTNAWHTVQTVRAAFAHVTRMMEQPPEIEPGRHTPLMPLAGDTAFEQVSFRYRADGPPVLHDINLAIEAGSIVGIVGPSGSGKSTLAHLIQGLYRPTSGRVLIDGTDVAHMPPAQLRAQIGCVPQDVQLFTGTVRDNIAMGVVDKDPARVVAVARFVGAHRFIERLPQGYDTMLGERGGGLSAGQKQLLCLARALIRNPRIIVLDEATSALDPATEEQFLRALRGSARGRTIIMITHRLAPLAIADKVVLLVDGRIERVGPPTEVMAYARIRMAEASRGHTAAGAACPDAGATAGPL